MSRGTSFPAYVKVEYQQDAGGFPALASDVKTAFDGVEQSSRRVSANVAGLEKSIAKALSMPRNAVGALDLNVSGLEESARNAEQAAAAARNLANATRTAATAAGDNSAQARLQAAALDAVANEQEQAAAKARSYATSQEQVQAQLNRTASQAQTLASGVAGLFDGADQSARRFSANIAEIEKSVARALSGPRTTGGALDLDVPGLKAGAAAAEAKAAAMRDLANAARAAATASTANGGAAAVELGQMERLAAEYEQTALAARSHATAMEQVQQQLNRTASAATKLSVTGPGVALAMQTGAAGATQLRMATIGAGQQLQDLVIQIGSGQRASTAFAQQLPQLAFALSYLEGNSNKALGALGKFGVLMSGPLGLAIPVVALALGGLATAMGEVDEAAKAAQKSSEDFREGLLDISKFADETTGHMIKLADATIRAALAMNSLKQAETANRAKALETEGVTKALEYARSHTVRLPGRAADGRPNLTSPGVSEALRASGFKSGLDGASGNLIVLERELQAAARTRPELKALADEVSVLAAQSVEAAKAMKDLRENADFLTGKREIVPGFKPPREKKERTPRERKAAEPYDTKKALASWLVDQDADIGVDIAKRLNSEAERALDIGTEIAEQRAEAGRKAIEDAQRELDLRLQMLGVVEQIGGMTGKAAAVLNGLLTGQFSGLGKAGVLLNMTSQTVGTDGWREVVGKLDQVFGGTSGDGTFARSMEKLLVGAGIGVAASSTILGGGGSNVGAAIGGAVGKKLGEKVLGPVMTKALGDTLGSFAGPLGSIAGGLLGGALGGLFKKAKYGTAVIGATSAGTLGITGTRGNSSSRVAAAEKSANALLGSLDSIAEQFGVNIDASKGKVSIGQWKGKWRVSTTGYSGKLNGSGNTGPTGKGLVDFGSDAAAAAEFAMLDLIKDGVLVGLRKGTQQLLTNAKELQDGLSKALKFENVFRDLKRAKDPVGAAVDDLNREFQSLINIFKQAGATAEETAQLEELYGIKRKAAVSQAFEQVSSALKSLLNDINIGDSGYSLRTRLANAQTAFNPLAAKVQAGDSTAYDAFTEASRQLMEISREYYGSGTEYFALLDQIKSISQGQVDYQQSLYDAANGSNALTFDIKPLVSATEDQTQRLAAAIIAQTGSANDNAGKQIELLRQLVSQNSAASYANRFNF